MVRSAAMFIKTMKDDCPRQEDVYGMRLIYRGTDRLFYSNDGLIFVSYNHGTTFYEIQIRE